MASVDEIHKILADVRSAIDKRNFYPVDRKKNLDTLATLGITWDDAKTAIYQLAVDEYYRGPKIDRDYPQTDKLWEFKKLIDGQVIYIKFKILYKVDGSVKVVSFHIDEP